MVLEAVTAKRVLCRHRRQPSASAGVAVHRISCCMLQLASRSYVRSAERLAVVALDLKLAQKVSSSFSRRASNCGCIRQPLRRLREKGKSGQLFNLSAAIETTRRGYTVTAWQLLGQLCPALPNPSLKASPNSVAHWPSSAGPAAHFALALQRATLSGPP